jgi:hypothetical protein
MARVQEIVAYAVSKSHQEGPRIGIRPKGLGRADDGANTPCNLVPLCGASFRELLI